MYSFEKGKLSVKTNTLYYMCSLKVNTYSYKYTVKFSSE